MKPARIFVAAKQGDTEAHTNALEPEIDPQVYAFTCLRRASLFRRGRQAA